MRKMLILGACTLVLLCLFLTPLARAAGGEKAEAIIWVADTRNLTGLWLWLAAMYNEAPLTHAILVIIVTAIVGMILGFGMDWIMQKTGLELEKRELRE